MGWLIHSKLQRLHRWNLGIDKWLPPTLKNACNYLSMSGLKSVHVSKWDRGRHANCLLYASLEHGMFNYCNVICVLPIRHDVLVLRNLVTDWSIWHYAHNRISMVIADGLAPTWHQDCQQPWWCGQVATHQRWPNALLVIRLPVWWPLGVTGPKVVMMPTLSSIVAPQAVVIMVMTSSGTVIDTIGSNV